MEGNLAYLSVLVTFMISVTSYDYFSGTLDGLREVTLAFLST